MSSALTADAQRAADGIRQADIVIGIPSFNNERTIGHVVDTCYAGLSRYFPQMSSVVVNADGGSTDRTREAVLTAGAQHSLLLLSNPVFANQRLEIPYHGVPGKGNALRTIFEVSQRLGARACAVVDSDLRSITPEWIDLLVRPILFANYEFVAPYYHRHKYDGTITNCIVYPLTRMLYGARLRQPISCDFALSSAVLDCYLKKDIWETDLARFGIDIWVTTAAVAEGFGVCQSFLGTKQRDSREPATDLSVMLQQVMRSVFDLMYLYENVWSRPKRSVPVPVFGMPFDVGLDPLQLNVQGMLREFRRGAGDLRDVWKITFRPGTFEEIIGLSRRSSSGGEFRFTDLLWARAILEFSVAYRDHPIIRQQLLGSLTPLYLGMFASFVKETEGLSSEEVEVRIEGLCRVFENLRPYLVGLWQKGSPTAPLPEEVTDV